MSVVVFLSNTNIQIATGAPSGKGVKVTKLCSEPLPEGAVLNGVVMDADMLTETLRSVWQINKLPKTEVMLILNSPQLRANRIDAPVQPDKKTTEYIKRETSDSDYGRFQNPVTGWYIVSKDNKAKMQKIIYETAEADFVKGYVDIFEKVGLKLASIHNGVQLAAEFFTKPSAGKTLIYMILDGNSLVTVFFAEGKYYYDSTSRLFAQPGTPEFAREIYNSVSAIRQFISAQHLNETVKDILFAGLTGPQVQQLGNDILNIDSEVDVSMVPMPQGTTISDGASAFPFYIYPIAGLRKIDEKLPILKASKENKAQASSNAGLKKLILPGICILAVAGITYGILLGVKASKKAELKEIEDYIYNPSVLAQVAEYDAMHDSMGEIGSIQGGVDLLVEDINSYPRPDSEINAMIASAAVAHDVDIEFVSYDATSGVFSVNAYSPVVDDINMFIADLMEMDIFENVEYTGYALTGRLTREADVWQINVVCTLAANDPAEEAGADGEVN